MSAESEEIREGLDLWFFPKSTDFHLDVCAYGRFRATIELTTEEATLLRDTLSKYLKEGNNG